MIKKSIKIELATGMETRPVALLVQVASQFSSNIYLETDNRRINAKSIMGMMALGLDTGESVTVVAEGEDEQEAFEKVEEYLTNR